MLIKDQHQTILELHKKGQSNRAIAKLLHVSRNTVRAVLIGGIDVPPLPKKTHWIELIPTLRETFIRCQGNAIRVQEILKEEYNTDIAYSTLTRLIQQYDLREP